jgi:hypothetical protein
MPQVSLRALVICAALTFGLVGCGNRSPEPPPKVPVEPPTKVVAELATEKERARSLEAQKAEEARRREIAEKDASSWKTATMLSVIGIVIALIVGVGIGSRARGKAERTKHDQ